MINEKKWMITYAAVPWSGKEEDLYITRDEEILLMQKYSFLPHMSKSELYSLILDCVEQNKSETKLEINF